MAIKNNSTPVRLSEQQLVDCDTNCNGCNGGLMDYAFIYAQSNPLETDANYPYTSGTTLKAGSCKYSASQGTTSVTGYYNVPAKNVSAMKAALDKQPVSVAVEASTGTFQYYTSGVITGTACGTSLDHGILAVGYGTEDGEDYFLVKNSWSSSWGDQGYVKIGQNNVCGILQMASYPTV